MIAKKHKEFDHASGRNKEQGLCQMCELEVGCNFNPDSQEPVAFCEEFQGVSPKPRPIMIAESQYDKKNFETENMHNSTPGLCRNCEQRKNCTFHKSEGGVWHCEEYK